jgi:hypothetical protein
MEVVNPDQTRFTFTITKKHRDKMCEYAKTYKITQGETIEVLLDFAEKNMLEGSANFAALFRAKREAKIGGRGKKSELFDKFKKLTPEQIAILEKLTAP